MNPAARWDYLALYDKGDVNGTEARVCAGNFLYSTGANEHAGRFTAGHFDLPLLGHTIEIHEDFDLFKMFRRVMREAADGWDGKDQLRPAPAELGETLGNAAV